MKINIRQIKPVGIELTQTFPADFAGLTGEDDARFITPIKVKAEVSRAADEIIAGITAASRYESFCGRCLQEVKRDWEASFLVAFDIDGKTEFIEMDEDIRQELVLNLPLRILCREDCRGLCVDCGVNLNNESCACAEKATKKVKVKT